MAAVTITADDLAPFVTIEATKAQSMIDDALAIAAVVAPCILTDDFAFPAAAKAIIRGAILRWNDAGSGAVTNAQAGSFGQMIDTRNPRKSMFWPSEITQLQGLCDSDGTSGDAFSVDMVGSGILIHNETCALYFGALYCSCGAVLTQGLPLYGA